MTESWLAVEVRKAESRLVVGGAQGVHVSDDVLAGGRGAGGAEYGDGGQVQRYEEAG